MEDGPLVTKALLSCTQSTEVLRRPGHNVSEELHHDSPSMLIIHGDVEKHHRVGVSRQRLGGRHLRGVGLRHAALAVCEGLSEGLGQLWSLELSRQLLDLSVSLCVDKHTDMKTAAGERSDPCWLNECECTWSCFELQAKRSGTMSVLVEFEVYTKICSLSPLLVIPMLQILNKYLKLSTFFSAHFWATAAASQVVGLLL